MILTLKTKTPVVVNARTSQEEVVFMSIDEVKYYGNEYIVPIQYYYEEKIDTGRLDNNNDIIYYNKKIMLPVSPPVKFTRAEAVGIEMYTGALNGTYHSDKFDSLILSGTMYQLNIKPVYDLGPTGWELVS